MKFFKIFVAAMLLALLIGMPRASVSADEVLLVPNDYPTIQGAVDAANPKGGDTIFIGPGEFAGAVITSSVKIIGSGNETKITSGSWPGLSAFAFIIWGVGFDVDETEIRNLIIDGDVILWGFYAEQANNVKIVNVTVNNPFYGIEGVFSDGLTIADSTFNNPGVGLASYSSDGLTIADSTFNNPYVGLSSYSSDGLTISNNTFNNSYRAIDIRNDSDCEVMHNRVFGLKARLKTEGLRSHSDGIFLGWTNDCVVAHNYVRHIGDAVGGYDEEFYVGIALASEGLPTEGNNFHHNRVEVSVKWNAVPASLMRLSLAHVFVDYGVVEDDLPISVKNNKLMHNNFLGSDSGENFYPAEVADYNFAKFNLFDE